MTEMKTQKHALPVAGVWRVGEFETLHSSVGFKVIHSAVTTYRSGFGAFSATFDAQERTFTGVVKVDSLQSFDLLRDRLFEPDLFDAASYPEIRFESSAVEERGDSLDVPGELTMKGVTKPVEATGVVHGTAPVFHFPTKTVHDHLGIDLRLTIDRTDFGVSFNNQLPNGVLNLGNEVHIELNLDFACDDPTS